MLKKTVVLVGMMGSGKSAVGKALAAHLGVAFLDSDSEIEKAADRTIKEIFERDGETFFRQAEARVIERLLSDTPMILATGGGAFMSADVRHCVGKKGHSLFLDANLATLWDRVKHSKTRPLLRTSNPKATLESLLTERRPTYLTANTVVT
ncbi:MAG: shikimate kinase, partial [Pseudomonadota bacterium]